MASETTWRRRVERWRASGQTAAEYSRGRGYAPATLLWWSSRLRESKDMTGAGLTFARVVVKDAGRSREASGVAVEVGGARVLLETEFDRDTLVAVLEILGDRGATAR